MSLWQLFTPKNALTSTEKHDLDPRITTVWVPHRNCAVPIRKIDGRNYSPQTLMPIQGRP